MKKMLESVQNFKTKRLEAVENYNKAMEVVNSNYIKGSDKYNERVKNLKEERDATIISLKSAGLEMVKQEFAWLRNQVQKAVSIVSSADIEKTIARIGKMSEMEKEILLSNFRGSYIDTKMLYDAMGKPFTNVDEIMADLTNLETSLQDYFDNYVADSYRCLNIEHGAWLNSVDEQVSGFISQYNYEE